MRSSTANAAQPCPNTASGSTSSSGSSPRSSGIGTASTAYAASAWAPVRVPRRRGRRGESRNRHANRGGRAAAAPGQRHAGAAQHHRAGKHQLAGQVAPPRPAGRVRARHAQRAHHAATHLQIRHEPAVGMDHQPLIERSTHWRRLYAHHSRSDSPPIIPRHERLSRGAGPPIGTIGNDPLCSTAIAPSIMAVNPCILLPASSLSHACRGSFCGCA